MARLLWRDAQGIEGSLDLASTEIRVGRAMDCAIRTDDAMVSRHHARIFWGGGGYVLEDLSSANGVYFQEQRVQSHLLKHGDAVRCGSLWLRFVDGGGGASVGPMPEPPKESPGPIGPVPPTIQNQIPVAPPPPQPPPGPSSRQLEEAEAEIRVLRRRVEQLQTELRMYRSNKFNADTVRRMEDLENEMSALEVERDSLKQRLERAEQSMQADSASAKAQRALQVISMVNEATMALNDLLSGLRIEVLTAEGEFDQYANAIPRASFDMIRQSLKNSAKACDEARDALRKLRDAGSSS